MSIVSREGEGGSPHRTTVRTVATSPSTTGVCLCYGPARLVSSAAADWCVLGIRAPYFGVKVGVAKVRSVKV